MTVVEVKTPSRAYEVHVGSGLLSRAGELAAGVCRGGKAVIVSDDTVGALYAGKLTESLRSAGFAVVLTAFAAGESSKTPDTLMGIMGFLANARLGRTDTVFALGGGVTGDLAGLAASLYMRGIGLVQVPTTILAAVDSSVGGKTAVDLPAGKNLMGTFYQPSMVLCDTDTLHSLPAREAANGCAEIVKTAFLRDASLLGALEGELDLERVIARCVSIKSQIVSADEREAGERQLLNFGHTFGHAIEKCADYHLAHGSAVAIGMTLMTRAAAKKGLCAPETLETLVKTLTALRLPTKTDLPAEEIFAAMLADKKRDGQTITFIVPRTVGHCERMSVNFDEARMFLQLAMEEDI